MRPMSHASNATRQTGYGELVRSIPTHCRPTSSGVPLAVLEKLTDRGVPFRSVKGVE
jgi:hypothetical protein